MGSDSRTSSATALRATPIPRRPLGSKFRGDIREDGLPELVEDGTRPLESSSSNRFRADHSHWYRIHQHKRIEFARFRGCHFL